MFDVDQAIGLKDYNGAKTLLIKNKNNIDSDEFEKKLLESYMINLRQSSLEVQFNLLKNNYLCFFRENCILVQE